MSQADKVYNVSDHSYERVDLLTVKSHILKLAVLFGCDCVLMLFLHQKYK